MIAKKTSLLQAIIGLLLVMLNEAHIGEERVFIWRFVSGVSALQVE